MNTEVILIILVVLLGIVNAVVVVCFISFWRKQAQLQASLSDSHLLEAYTREFSRIAESWNKTAETWNELGKAGAKVGGNFQTFDALLSAQLRSVEQLDQVIQRIDDLLSAEMEGKKHQEYFWSDIFHRIEHLIDESRHRDAKILRETLTENLNENKRFAQEQPAQLHNQIHELIKSINNFADKFEMLVSISTSEKNNTKDEATKEESKSLRKKVQTNEIPLVFTLDSEDVDFPNFKDTKIEMINIPSADCVNCSVFAPPFVSPGGSIMIQVFAHFHELYEEVYLQAREYDEEAKKRGSKSLASKIIRGSELMFDLVIPTLQINNPVESLIWNGHSESVQFVVQVPVNHLEQNIIGTLTVSQNSIPIGHIHFKLSITKDKKTFEQENIGEEAKRYNRAFISYASEDRSEVLSRVQMLKQLSITYFQDVLNLNPGERWERKIYKHIDECDVFFLFWSKNAKKSKWVRKEADYALDRKRGIDENPPEIKPVIIEKPPIEPWEELNHLHFNDALIYFKN